MEDRGVVIAFSGALGSGSSDLSRIVAERLGWDRVKFSDHIRVVARSRDDDPNDRGVLQRIGQELVQQHCEAFVKAVLARAEWRGRGCLVVDGLRHTEVRAELGRQIGDRAGLWVVHIDMDLAARAERARRSEGLSREEFALFEADLTEAQLERILPQYADLRIDGRRSHEELAELVILRFAPGHQARSDGDRGEDVSRFEPLTVGEGRRGPLADLVVELLADSKDLVAELPAGVRDPLSDVVRSMNCYYSNFIEGHETRPVDIEKALRKDWSSDADKRNLQLEAVAHIGTQAWIDGGGLKGRLPTSEGALREIHSRFCSALPSDLLWATNSETGERWRIAPGEYRQHDVRVGRHDAPSPGAVPRFMRRLESAYGRPGRVDQILSAATAHHRLLWVHPFMDGNGRVARLMSHAILAESLGSGGLWSIARGLARQHEAYKHHLASCDLGRRNDLDGRGPLSEETLVAFVEFFLEACLDQVKFMRGLMQGDRIRFRVRAWADEEIGLGKMPAGVRKLMDTVLSSPDLPYAEAVDLLGDTGAEATIRRLLDIGIVSGGDARGALRMAFPTALSERLLPGLFLPA